MSKLPKQVAQTPSTFDSCCKVPSPLTHAKSLLRVPHNQLNGEVWFTHGSAQYAGTDAALQPHLKVTLKDSVERKSSKRVEL